MKCINMMKIIVNVCFTFVSVVNDVAICLPDYQHNDNVIGWMKLHKSPATFKEAFLKCYYEGAILASPINEALTSLMNNKRRKTDGIIWVGTHSLFSEGDFLSAEGVALNDMPISVTYGVEADDNCVIITGVRQAHTTNCSRQLPYVCYRNRREQSINFKCGTFDNKYQFEPRTGSCYKLHEERQDWPRAHSICAAEGGYLAVINNEEEANIIKHRSSKRTLKISKFDDWEPMFIGLRDWDKKGVWSTVLGDSIQKVYHTWGWGQPDNLGHDQYCGSLLRTGKLDDTWCHVKALFMCEKDPKKGRFEYPYVTNLTKPDSLQPTVEPKSG